MAETETRVYEVRYRSGALPLFVHWLRVRADSTKAAEQQCRERVGRYTTCDVVSVAEVTG